MDYFLPKVSLLKYIGTYMPSCRTTNYLTTRVLVNCLGLESAQKYKYSYILAIAVFFGGTLMQRIGMPFISMLGRS